MHLTCVEKDKLDEALAKAKAGGCQNILALRGDPPLGSSTWEPVPTGFATAAELVRYIRQQYGDYFCISVAGFPAGHPETSADTGGEAQELAWLKEKVDAGADFIFTQMFYDVDLFVGWVRKVRAAGITVPIVPGIMPIQSYATFSKWVARENILVPDHFYAALEPVKDDDSLVRAVGTQLVGAMCKAILAADVGITGLHIYTLNLAVGARMLLEEVGLVAKAEQVNPLPWTPSLTPARRNESIRPIVGPPSSPALSVLLTLCLRLSLTILTFPPRQFWANRQHSYLSRSKCRPCLCLLPLSALSDTLPPLPFLTTTTTFPFPSRELGRVPQRPLGRLAFARVRRVPRLPAPADQRQGCRALGPTGDDRRRLRPVPALLSERAGA
jgi:5,10-methylenetetrahydrofolate reductase